MPHFKNQRKLISYSALTIAYLGLHHSTDAQAVYTDIDPDIVLSEDFNIATVDMNNDGIKDFIFTNFSYSTYSYSLGSIRKEILWAGPFTNSFDAMAGDIGTFEGFYPYALSAGISINNALQFNNWWYQRLAFKTILSNGHTFNKGGHWYPEETDHYVGIKFEDDSANMHYGWIRCDVIDSGRTLILKDYAYELKPNTPIRAGDMIGDTSTVFTTTLNNKPFIAYPNPANDFLTIKIPMNAIGCQLQMIDVQGNVVKAINVNSSEIRIDIRNMTEGTYLLLVDGIPYDSKIIIMH